MRSTRLDKQGWHEYALWRLGVDEEKSAEIDLLNRIDEHAPPG